MAEIALIDNPAYAPFRLVVIDGDELGPDHNGGRVVCMNGTGDLPLSSYTIDPAMCAPEVPVIAHVDVPIPAVPEPGSWVLLAVGLVAVGRKVRSSFHPAVLSGSNHGPTVLQSTGALEESEE